MKRLYTSFFFALFAAVVMSACVSTPALDTPEKQLAAAEISWKHTLLAVEKNLTRLSDRQRTRVTEQLVKINKALQAARLAVKLADGSIDLSSNLATVNSGLTVIRTVLEEIEQQEKV